MKNILNSFEEKIKTLSPRLDAHGEPRAEAVEQILSEYSGTLHQGESSSPRASFSPVTEAEAVLLRDADAWKKAVDAFLADKLSRKSLIPVLSQTPLVFQLVGAKNLPMVTRQKVLTKVLKEKHHLDPELVKQIPKALAEPVMIVRSTGVDANSDITVVLDLRDRHRATVVVPVMFSDTGHGYEMNFLPSIYVKNDEKTKMPNNQWFVEQMISGNVLYADKKKVTEWNRVAKRQLPGWNSIPNAKTLFTKDDLVKLRVRYSGRYQGESSSPRASFSPVTEAKGIIRFFQSADISSAGHEIGHSLRRVLELGANMDNSPDFVRRDWESACAFVGAEPGAAWTVAQEEKFADSFVDYQQKGPPSAGLRRAFTRPARRLTERQRRIRGLDVQVSPEMSRVFERLPVTERELAAAKQREESEYMR